MREKMFKLLRWSEKYTKTDMVYIAKGVFWGNINLVFLTVLSFIISILFARLLSKETYGTYQYVLSIAALVGATTLTGMNSAVTRSVAQGYEGDVKKSVRYQIMLGIIPTAIAFGISLWYYLHDNNNLALSFVWVGAFLPVANALNTWAAYTGGKKLFKIGTLYGLLNTFITLAGIMLITYLTRNFVWIIFANFFFTLVSNYITYTLIVRHVPPNTNTSPETIPYGKHLSLMAIPSTISTQLDAFLIFHFIGAAPLAIYSFATIIPEKLAGGLKLFSNIALPKFAARTDTEVKHFLARRIWGILIFVACVAALYALAAPYLFKLFFPEYMASVKYTQVYALSLFSIAANFVQTAILSQRKTRELYIINISMPIIKTILLVGLMYFYGIWGLIWAQIIIHFISIPFQLLLYKMSPSKVS